MIRGSERAERDRGSRMAIGCEGQEAQPHEDLRDRIFFKARGTADKLAASCSPTGRFQ
jgi:hypothetical protein